MVSTARQSPAHLGPNRRCIGYARHCSKPRFQGSLRSGKKGLMRQRCTSSRVFVPMLVALFGLGAGNAVAATTPKLPIHPCELPGIARPVRCGVLEVLENPDRPDGRRLGIHIAVIRGSSGKGVRDPIVVLMGGPGEDAIGAAALYATQFAPVLEDRDLLLVDQRGTGRSAALKCPLFSPETAADNVREFFPLAAVKRCKRLLEASADLTRYTFPYFATDLEQVRRALGYGPLNLFA